MKDILFKKMYDLEKGTKSLSISQHSDDEESQTLVRKSFIYKVHQTKEENPVADPPQIYIKKQFDTKEGKETFDLKVKGIFYMTHKRKQLEVSFQHTLNIDILWKSKVLSPQ